MTAGVRQYLASGGTQAGIARAMKFDPSAISQRLSRERRKNHEPPLMPFHYDPAQLLMWQS